MTNKNDYRPSPPRGKISWEWIKREVELKQAAYNLEEKNPLLFKYYTGKIGKSKLFWAAIVAAAVFVGKFVYDVIVSVVANQF